MRWEMGVKQKAPSATRLAEFAIGMGDEFILPECGIKREFVDGQVGFYPTLTKGIVSKIKVVFLSHCHEDRVAGYPLLYELGDRGKVYATAEIIAEALGFVKKWMGFVEKNHGESECAFCR